MMQTLSYRKAKHRSGTWLVRSAMRVALTSGMLATGFSCAGSHASGTRSEIPPPTPAAAPNSGQKGVPDEGSSAGSHSESKPTVPLSVAISDLKVNRNATIRISGVVSETLGVQLVPARIIFVVSDGSGSVSALLNENKQFASGTRIELVGRYHEVRDPLHRGGEPVPITPMFVVERFLDLPAIR